MKELQFKTGGRRLRIEDLEALQDGIKGASAFLGASKQNFVVTGCEVSVTRAVLNRNYDPITGTGGNFWASVQLTISDGYVFMDGKLRKVAGKVFNITNVNEVVYLVVNNNLTNNIIYYDGTVGSQFHDYGAELIMSKNEPEGTFMLMNENVNLKSSRNPSLIKFKFSDFKTGFLSVLALPRSGGNLDNNATVIFESMSDNSVSKVEIDGNSARFKSITNGKSGRSLHVFSDGLNFFDDDGDFGSEIRNEYIAIPRVMADYIGDRSGNEVDTEDLCPFFAKLKKNIIQFNDDSIQLVRGVKDSENVVLRGDKLHLSPGVVSINKSYDNFDSEVYSNELYLSAEAARLTKAKTDGSMEFTSIDSSRISSNNIVGAKFYVSSIVGSTTKPGITVDIPVGDKILKIVSGIVIGYNTPSTADDSEI